MYGADRIGGTMLASAVVWGLLSAADIVQKYRHLYPRSSFIAEKKKLAIGLKKTENYFENYNTLPYSFRESANVEMDEIKKVLRRYSWNNLLVIKSENSLKSMISELDALSSQAAKNNSCEIEKSIEVENLLLIARSIVASSAMRRESRGSFYREDFPAMDKSKPVFSARIFLENGEISTDVHVPDNKWSFSTDISSRRWG